MNKPISNKVATGTLSGTAVSVLTWALTTFIPAWHSGIPAQLGTLLPAAVGVAGYFAGGYLARHYPTLDEALQVVNEAKTQLAQQ